MGGEKPKADGPEVKEDYDATVIDFLDQEIVASTKSTGGRDAAPDELDTLVTNLLQDVMTTSEKEPPPTEADEDLDALLSGIFKQSEADQSQLHDAPREMSSPDAGFRANNIPSKVAAAAIGQRSEPTQAQRVMMSSDVALDAGKGGPRKPELGGAIAQPVARPETKVSKSKLTAVKGHNPLFALLRERSASSHHRLVIAAACVCLIASIGFGVYHFAGSSSHQSAAVNPQHASNALTQPAAMPVSTSSNPQPQSAVTRKEAAAARNKPVPTPTAAPFNSARALKGDSAAPPTSAEVAPAPLPPVNPRALETPSNTPANAVSTVAPPVSEPPAPPTISAADISLPARLPERGDNVSAALPAPKPLRPVPAAAIMAGMAASSKPGPATMPARPALTPPVSISQVTPIYPELAKRMHVSGTVVVELEIDAQGSVSAARVVSGPAVLTDAALEAVKKWRYRPAAFNGKNVPGAARVSIEFKSP